MRYFFTDDQSFGSTVGPWKIAELSAPNQPRPDTIPKQQLKGRQLSFNAEWYELFPWLHICPARKKALCFYCAKAHELGKTTGHQESAFCWTGFSNWKKGRDKFREHAASKAHQDALYASTARPATEVLESAATKDMKTARENLTKIVTSVMFLAKQGLAIRGHGNDEGNLLQLLHLRSSDCPDLKRWLQRKETFTHPECQNEILQLVSNEIVRDVVAEIMGSSEDDDDDRDMRCRYFAVIVDGTQDVSGTEQQSVSLRYVDDSFCVHEEFVGFFEPKSTTGADIALMITDALCRLGLPISRLRGMAFDGAANMSGKIGGAQAHLKRQQPAALFVHCGAHVVNLVARDCAETSTLIRNALQTVNEIGALFSQSIKFREKFAAIRSEEGDDVQKLRPLCQTRWTVRLAAVEAIVQQYDDVLDALHVISSGNSGVSVRASGLHVQLNKGSTLMALLMARVVLTPLDRLKRLLQRETCSVSDLLDGVKRTVQLLCAQKDQVRDVVAGLRRQVEKSGCGEPVEMPRMKRPPARFSEAGDSSDTALDVDDYMCKQLVSVLDEACADLQRRFEQDGVKEHAKMEDLLLGRHDGVSVSEQLEQSPWAADLSAADLSAQLRVLFGKDRQASMRGAIATVSNMPRASRKIFPDAVKLVQLLLTLPASERQRNEVSAPCGV